MTELDFSGVLHVLQLSLPQPDGGCLQQVVRGSRGLPSRRRLPLLHIRLSFPARHLLPICGHALHEVNET